MKAKFLFYIFLLIFVIACAKQQENQVKQIKTTSEVSNMKLTSSVFVNNGTIPSEYTCDDSNISPHLMISEVPKNAKSLALIMDDPDAVVGTFVHWVAWNIPPDTEHLQKASEPKAVLGKGGSGKLGYIGPCPPSGTHRYFFKLYALDTTLNLPEGSSKADLENAMQGHIMEQTQLMGTYKRR